MPVHIRTQIRNAFVAQLTGLSSTGARVFKSRGKALKDNQLPALLINTNDEDINLATFTDDDSLERALIIEVIAKAKATDDLDDVLDEIIRQVEAKINISTLVNTLDGLVKSISLTSINIDFDDQGEKQYGQARMNFNATYFNQANSPDIAI